MDKELRKRLEEAAKKYADEYAVGDAAIIVDLIHKVAEDGFLAGAEHGYKEAIALAKEWLKDLCERVGFTGMTINQTADTFETDMNILWEDEK